MTIADFAKQRFERYIAKGHTKGHSVCKIADTLGVNNATVYELLGIQPDPVGRRRGDPKKPSKPDKYAGLDRDAKIRAVYAYYAEQGHPEAECVRLTAERRFEPRATQYDVRGIVGLPRSGGNRANLAGLDREGRIKAIFAKQLEYGLTESQAVRRTCTYKSGGTPFCHAEVRRVLGLPDVPTRRPQAPKAPKAKAPKPITTPKTRTVVRAEYSSEARGVVLDTRPKPPRRKPLAPPQFEPRPTAEVIAPGLDVFRPWGDIAPEKRWECVLKANYSPEEMERYIVGPGQGVTALVNALAIDTWLKSQPVSARLRAEEIARNRILEEQL
ncbi:MAG: hypothetical protein ACOYOL_12485 [Chthoniobacterales bacterium]